MIESSLRGAAKRTWAEGPAARAIDALRTSDPLRLIAVAVALVAVASVTLQEIASGTIQQGGGCGYDGAQYCAMAQGQLADAPYSHRILMPLLVQFTGPADILSIIFRFQVLDVLSLLAMVAGVFVLTLRVSRALGVVDRHRAMSAAILAGALAAVAPMAFHHARYYPVLTDTAPLALGTWWVICVTGRGRAWQWASVPLAFLTIIAREVWIPAIVVTPVVLLAFKRMRSTAILCVATEVAAGLGAWLALAQPDTGNPSQSFFEAAGPVLRLDFLTGAWGLSRVAWMGLFALGLVPFIVFRRPRALLAGVRDDSRSSAPLIVPMGVSGVLLVAASFGGWDLQRYVFAVAPFVFALAAAHVARHRRLDAEVALLALATLLLWRPFEILPSTTLAWFNFFAPEYLPVPGDPTGAVFSDRVAQDALLVAFPIAAWLAVIAYRTWRERIGGARLARLTS